MGFEEYRDEIYREYAIFRKSLPPPDTPGYRDARQPIIDFCDGLDDDRNAPEDTLKSVVARMFAAKNQFTGLVIVSIIMVSCWSLTLNCSSRRLHTGISMILL